MSPARRGAAASAWSRHGSRAGDLAVIPQHALAGIDHADAFAFRFKDRALLDMQFDEPENFWVPTGARATIADAVQCLGHSDALGILARENIVSGVKSPT